MLPQVKPYHILKGPSVHSNLSDIVSHCRIVCYQRTATEGGPRRGLEHYIQQRPMPRKTAPSLFSELQAVGICGMPRYPQSATVTKVSSGTSMSRESGADWTKSKQRMHG